MPLISIVIPTFNQANYLHDTLLSIYNQTFTDYEIIVVDDGSTDDTQSVVKRHYNRIRYIYQPNSGGCSQPRNRGIAAATGTYIADFDSDDLMHPMKLAHQYRFLEDNPTLDFVFTDFQNFEDNQIHSPHTLSCTDFRAAKKRNLDASGFLVSSRVAFKALITENYIGGSSPFFRKTLIDQIGGFDESLDVSEDLDLWFRVTLNHDIGFIDEVFHYRRLHSRNITTNIPKMHSNALQAYSKQLTLISDPSTRRALRQRIAEVYCSLGYYHRNRKEFHAALRALRSGIRVCPAYPRLYHEILKSVVLRIGFH